MKRFTETSKWDDSWFGELPAPAKLLWMFLCDNVDHAGVWEPNQRLADFKIGLAIDWVAAPRWFGDRVRVLPSGRWLLPKYVRFQNPHGLKPSDKFTKSVLQRLQHHGLTLADVGLTPDGRPAIQEVELAASQQQSAEDAAPAPAPAPAPASSPDGDQSASEMPLARGMHAPGKGHAGGMHAPQRQRKDNTHALASLERGGSRGDPPPAGRPPGPSNAERLSQALRRHGLDANPGARQEWGDLLQGRGRCTTVEEVLAALDWIMARARRDGVQVRYAKHAAEFADVWASRRKDVA